MMVHFLEGSGAFYLTLAFLLLSVVALFTAGFLCGRAKQSRRPQS